MNHKKRDSEFIWRNYMKHKIFYSMLLRANYFRCRLASKVLPPSPTTREQLTQLLERKFKMFYVSICLRWTAYLSFKVSDLRNTQFVNCNLIFGGCAVDGSYPAGFVTETTRLCEVFSLVVAFFTNLCKKNPAKDSLLPRALVGSSVRPWGHDMVAVIPYRCLVPADVTSPSSPSARSRLTLF